MELYLRAVCRDAHLAEELTEQVFFRALKALPEFRGDCDIRTWLCTMGRNAYLSHLRKQKPTVDVEELNIPDPRQGIEERICDQEQAMDIHRILHALPEPYKEVFSLFGKTANWACVTYHRARQKIKDALEVSE